MNPGAGWLLGIVEFMIAVYLKIAKQMVFKGSQNKEMIRAEEIASVVKSICCSFRRPGFGYQQWHDNSQPLVTPSLGHLTTESTTHMADRYTQAHKLNNEIK